ncbi:hypothetical protein Sipo8835_22970 [Streptomyces ipomoeae]|uniref:Helix-turn-helix domain-containing protein n=1 Tax=Streptomyces ipomoeae TaxID=103232 RepID=A0AAE8W2Q5_9ACTN|nr:helix-turn-helix domain-containing protein [Streptomyces ipomoeae]TQE30858.1 hypothetical protein Sipo8835_22970 [Streptomyces ipomoeae]
MSIHLMVVAAYLPKSVVNSTQKLVLMKICDSADEETRIARPGLERMMAWSGVNEKRVPAVVTELVELGLVQRITVGRAGRRAEYRVFPLGVPPIPTTDMLVERRREAREGPKNERLARPGVRRAKPVAAARTHEDVAARKAARAESQAEAEPGLPEGNPAGEEKRVPPGEPSGFPQGNRMGSPRGTPSLPSSSSHLHYPPTPTADAAGEPASAGEDPGPRRGCPKHATPAGNCRGCGTNARAARERQRQEEIERERAAEQTWLSDWKADLERHRRAAEADPAAVAKAREAAYELARRGKTEARKNLKGR